MSVFLPPREGITLEYLCRPIYHVVLQPIVPAALLLASIKFPQDSERLLSLVTKDAIQLGTVKLLLKGLLAIGVVDRLNRYMSRLTMNNFVSDRTWDWQREIVLITGGCSGIGAQMVRLFAERNIKVVVLDINPPKAPLPGSVQFYKLDVTSAQGIKEVAAKIRLEVGDPTVLINNAGIGTGKNVLDETDEELHRTFDVNIFAHFRLIKEFLPHMIKHDHGHVVAIASMASFATWAANVSYSATKAGVLSFHEGLSQELWARYGAKRVRTTIVHPVWVRTPLAERTISRSGFSEFILEPETVAEAVVSQVLKGEGAQLIFPARFSGVTTIRGWPSWMQILARSGGAHYIQG